MEVIKIKKFLNNVAESVVNEDFSYYMFWIILFGSELIITYNNYEFYKFFMIIRTIYLAIYFILVLSSHVFIKHSNKDSKKIRNNIIILGLFLVLSLIRLRK